VDGPDDDPHREAVGIVDFKAHRINSIDKYEDLKTKVEQQLRLYANAVRYAFPYEPAVATAQLITPAPPTPELKAQGVRDRIEVDVSKDTQEAALAEVREAVAGIKQSLKQQSFECLGPRNGWCKSCDFRKFCPGYPKWKSQSPSHPPPPDPLEERESEIDDLLDEYNARD
jgi:DNA helicase-2/ATP-dependent DNA helicase PcrA